MIRVLLVIAVTGLAALATTWKPGSEAASAQGVRGFTGVSLSDCTDWRAAELADRQRLLADLADHFGHESHIWGGATLPGNEARRVIEATCAAREARRIKLYKIYARALTFRAYRD